MIIKMSIQKNIILPEKKYLTVIMNTNHSLPNTEKS